MIPVDASRGASSWWRWSVLVASLFLALAGTLVILDLALEFEEIGSFPTDLNGTERAKNLKRRFRAAGARRPVHNILMLGDSMLMPRKETGFDPAYALPGRVQTALEGLAPDAAPARHVVSTPYPGEGYTSFYFLADRLIEAGPDQVLIEFNPGAMSTRWRGHASRPDYVAFLGWRRIPEALMLPLHKFGLTADRVLWTVACQELGGVGLWREVAETQGRVTKLRDALHEHAAALVGSHAEQRFKKDGDAHRFDRNYSPDFRRNKKPSYMKSYGEALAGVGPDDVSIRMMNATVRRFVDAGIPTSVYVIPINVEHMREVGAWTGDGLQRSLDRLGEGVVAAGGTYADFHDLLPDVHFLDVAGHLTFEGEQSGNVLLARELAPLILEQTGIAPREPRSTD